MRQYAPVQQRLGMALQAWREQTRDPLLDPDKLAALTRQHDEVRRRVEAAGADADATP